jgi:hypothetical protein
MHALAFIGLPVAVELGETKYPNAPVTAPLANLPPPATEARPPTTALLIKDAA